MKIKRITTKLLASIIPIIIVALGVVTLLCVSSARSNLNDEISDKMQAKVEWLDANLSDNLNKIEYATQGLGRSIGSSMMLLSSDITAYRTLCIPFLNQLFLYFSEHQKVFYLCLFFYGIIYAVLTIKERRRCP